MKLRRLPEIDLANIASRPKEDRETLLYRFTKGGGSWSYEPARKQTFNIFHPTNPLGLSVPKATLEQIEAEIEKECRRDDQLKSNREVVRLLYNWSAQNCTRSIERRIPSMAIGSIGTIRYWNNLATMYGNRATFPFLDHRRQNGFSTSGLRFAFSMMHQQIRVADPDFEDAQLLILKFSQAPGQERQIIPITDNGFELYSLDELYERVSETYEIFEKVLRETKRHKKAA